LKKRLRKLRNTQRTLSLKKRLRMKKKKKKNTYLNKIKDRKNFSGKKE